jgi:hypothetical protein
MKNIMVYLIFLIFSINFSFALPVGVCKAVVNSKNYIEGQFTTAYPRKIKFTCVYECASDRGFERLLGVSQMVINHQYDDAIHAVCQGIQVKKGLWGYEFNGNSSFYAHNTRILELKAWARENIHVYSKASLPLLKEFKHLLKRIIIGYLQAGSSGGLNTLVFLKAANKLQLIVDELPGNPDILEPYLHLLAAGYDTSHTAALSSEKLILNIIKSKAFWMIE